MACREPSDFRKAKEAHPVQDLDVTTASGDSVSDAWAMPDVADEEDPGTPPTATTAATAAKGGSTKLSASSLLEQESFDIDAVIADEGCMERLRQSDTHQHKTQARGEDSAGDIYRRAISLMWSFDLKGSEALLESSCRLNPWHAAAYAEVAFLKVLISGRLSDANVALERVDVATELLAANKTRSDASRHSDKVLSAELTLMRCGLQVVLGARLRALLSLRQCWQAYRKLETCSQQPSSSSSSSPFSASPLPSKCSKAAPAGTDTMVHAEDLLARIQFGVGAFLLSTSLLPSALAPLLRLAGFVVDRQRGKEHLASASEGESVRSILASVFLSLFHIDLEPNLPRSGELLVSSLGKTPRNPFLHWTGSLLAWRSGGLDQAAAMTSKALLCLDPNLAERAIFLRYELGIINLMRMQWVDAHPHLRSVYETLKEDKVFFMYRLLVPLQLAAVAAHIGSENECSSLLAECIHSQGFAASSSSRRLERDFASLAEIFATSRGAVSGRKMLVFEVLYFLKQFSRIPAAMLTSMAQTVREYSAAFSSSSAVVAGAVSSQDVASKQPLPLPSSERADIHTERFAEYISARTMEIVLLFYLGDLDTAMDFVPLLASECRFLPKTFTYLTAHCLYWCGRILALSGWVVEAKNCLVQGKALRTTYPFNISKKMSTVLTDLENNVNVGESEFAPVAASTMAV